MNNLPLLTLYGGGKGYAAAGTVILSEGDEITVVAVILSGGAYCAEVEGYSNKSHTIGTGGV